ncbi:AAA family ATPase [Nannocystis pusilla]|uniref:AAA family ATPase n=1 Tax=Nannocystis pusilla TaxID=889268 RepID=UPI003B7DAEBC
MSDERPTVDERLSDAQSQPDGSLPIFAIEKNLGSSDVPASAPEHATGGVEPVSLPNSSPSVGNNVEPFSAGHAPSTARVVREDAAASADARAPDPWDAMDADTVTLSIKKDATRLYRGLCLQEDRPALWERPLAIDWAERHFDDGGEPCSLATATIRLPDAWGRDGVEGFGATLAALLFGASAGDPAVTESLVLAPGVQRRVVLLLDETTFGVPWEYLKIGDRFIAEQALSIVRHVRRVNGAPKSLKIKKPAKISFAYANPGPRETRFDGDAHRKAISAAISTFCTNIDPAEQCTAAGLESLLRRPSELFHFLGHGAAGGLTMPAALILHDGATGKKECPAETIATWIREMPRDLVVLGACFGAAVPQQRLVAGVGWRIVRESGVPVVAMQMEVPQDFSTAFCARFYEELATGGFDVELAVYMARRASHEGRHAFGIAVLLADAEALTARPLARLPAPEAIRWAQFAPRALLKADEAGSRWRGSEVVPDAQSVADAIELDAKHNPTARYPAPPADRTELRAQVGELWRTISDTTAREKLAEHARRQSVVPALRQSVVIDTADDLKLHDRRSLADCGEAIERAQRGLSLPNGLVLQIAGELLADKHVLLTGPVGTGKSSLARAVAEALDYEVLVETASADWTRFEIQGGHWPVPTENGMSFEFRAGVFLEAVLANWEEQADDQETSRRTWRRRQRPSGARGCWLVLDELNRADVDRALGGIFTALETRRLRVPVSDGRGSVDIPIPEDFRVIATINAADRHFLFRLSDALKRRFAFVHVPVTDRWNDEWNLLTARERLNSDDVSADLRRFVALVRVLHPVGTALVQSALRFLVATESVQASGDWRLTQAIGGSILPNLEDLRAKRLLVLQRWAESADPDALATALLDALPNPASVPPPTLAALAACPPEMSPHWRASDEAPPREAGELSSWIARRVARAAGATLPSLARALADLVSHAPVA